MAGHGRTKEIRSASADDETLSTFTSVSGNRAEIELASSGYASDPDVVALSDGTYLLYVSSGQDTLVFTASSLGDTFVSPDGATDRKMSDAQGGVPAAIQAPDGSVWLYVTTSASGVESIRMATSPDGVTALASADFSTVIDSTISPSFTPATYVSSPSIIAWPDGDWVDRSDE